MQPSSGPITTSGCASPDLVEGLFQTRQPTQYCEWRNGINGRDAVCYCGTNECNAKEILENWIQNGGGCELFFTIFRNKKKSKRSKVMWQIAYYLIVKKGQIQNVQCLRKFWNRILKYISKKKNLDQKLIQSILLIIFHS